MSTAENRFLADESCDFRVLLIRFPGNARGKLANTIVELIRDRGDELLGAMTVIQPSYVRIRHKQE